MSRRALIAVAVGGLSCWVFILAALHYAGVL
jgi:hypothetical protein